MDAYQILMKDHRNVEDLSSKGLRKLMMDSIDGNSCLES